MRFSRMPLDRIAALFGDNFARELAQSADRALGRSAAIGLWVALGPGDGRRTGGNCRHSSRFGRQWSESGSPSTAPRRRRLSIKPSSPATE